MKVLMKKTGIYLLAFIVAVVSPGCTTTQAVTSEPPTGTNQQINNASGSETAQAQENQAGTAPEEKTTEGSDTSAVADAAGKVAVVILAATLVILFYAAIDAAIFAAF